MCNGCTAWGKNTRFGRGNRRATPRKSAKGGWSGVMPSLVLMQKVRWIGPLLRGRIRMQFGDQRFVNGAGAFGLIRGQHRSEARLHLPPKRFDIDVPEARAEAGHVIAAGTI